MIRNMLHIGTHKTGSTYLQKTLDLNRDVLLEDGYDYTEFGRRLDDSRLRHNHRYISSYLRGRTGEYPMGFEPEKLLSHVVKDCRFIVSSENLYFINPLDNREIITNVFGSNLKVIVFLRSPDAHVVSYWKEKVKGGYNQSIDDLLRFEIAAIRHGSSYYNFQKQVERWRMMADTEVLIYNESPDESKLLLDFFRCFGAESSYQKLKALPGRENAPWDDHHIALLLQVNQHLHKVDPGNELLITEKMNAKREILKAFSRCKDNGGWGKYAPTNPYKIVYDQELMHEFLRAFIDCNAEIVDLFPNLIDLQRGHLLEVSNPDELGCLAVDILQSMINDNQLPEAVGNLLLSNGAL